jgi:hypothetical protein
MALHHSHRWRSSVGWVRELSRGALFLHSSLRWDWLLVRTTQKNVSIGTTLNEKKKNIF